MYKGAWANFSSACAILRVSSCHNDPVRNLCESTRATEHNIRCSNASFDISSENTATVFASSMAAFSAIFIANDVFPIDGRAAMMMRSDFWKPLVSSSRSA